jgi:hypothetical protein
MGAEFFFTYFPVCIKSDVRMEKVLECINSIREDDFDPNDLEMLVHQMSFATKEQVIVELFDHGHRLFENEGFWKGGDYAMRRDVGIMTVGGRDYAITGGMSYGDEPTDSYPEIERLSWIPCLWGLIEAFSMEDNMEDTGLFCGVIPSKE